MLRDLREPDDYLKGVGRSASLPIPTNTLLFLRRTRENLQQTAIQNRSHHRFVLIYNLGTAGSVHIDNRVVRLLPGKAVLIMPYQFHHFSHLTAESLEWLFCTFELSEESFLEPFRHRVIDPGRGSMDALRLLLNDWRRCCSPDKTGAMQEAQLQTALLYLLVSLREDLQAQAQDLPPEPRDSLLRSVHRIMTEWRGRSVSVEDVASAMGISASRLRVRFKETAGVPLGRYLLNYRLHRAMALLRTTSLPISEIATETGFGSPEAFSRAFRQKMDLSPRAFRNEG